MIKIKIKSLLSEVTSTAPMSNSQQPNTGFGIVDIIFKHYGFIPIQYLGGGQFSKVYLLDPVDTSKYEGMGRQRFIGKVSQSPIEYEAYKKAKDVKEQVSQDKAHPEYAKYLPTIYVAEQIDVGGFNSVIISEKLQKLDPNVQQLMYGGVESEGGLTTIDQTSNSSTELPQTPPNLDELKEYSNSSKLLSFYDWKSYKSPKWQ
jgi:hypothetical protein